MKENTESEDTRIQTASVGAVSTQQEGASSSSAFLSGSRLVWTQSCNKEWLNVVAVI